MIFFHSFRRAENVKRAEIGKRADAVRSFFICISTRTCIWECVGFYYTHAECLYRHDTTTQMKQIESFVRERNNVIISSGGLHTALSFFFILFYSLHHHCAMMLLCIIFPIYKYTIYQCFNITYRLYSCWLGSTWTNDKRDIDSGVFCRQDSGPLIPRSLYMCKHGYGECCV